MGVFFLEGLIFVFFARRYIVFQFLSQKTITKLRFHLGIFKSISSVVRFPQKVFKSIDDQFATAIVLQTLWANLNYRNRDLSLDYLAREIAVYY